MGTYTGPSQELNAVPQDGCGGQGTMTWTIATQNGVSIAGTWTDVYAPCNASSGSFTGTVSGSNVTINGTFGQTGICTGWTGNATFNGNSLDGTDVSLPADVHGCGDQTETYNLIKQ